MGVFSKKLRDISERESRLMELHMKRADKYLDKMICGESIDAGSLFYYSTKYDRAVRMSKRSCRISGLCNKILKVIGK